VLTIMIYSILMMENNKGIVSFRFDFYMIEIY